MQDQPKQRGGFRGGVRPKNEYPKKKITVGVEIRLLEHVPSKGRENWVNDAIRDKINKERYDTTRATTHPRKNN